MSFSNEWKTYHTHFVNIEGEWQSVAIRTPSNSMSPTVFCPYCGRHKDNGMDIINNTLHCRGCAQYFLKSQLIPFRLDLHYPGTYEIQQELQDEDQS